MTSPTMTDELIEVIARAIQFEGSTYAEKAQAALDAIAAAGYAVVPREPTAEMINAGLTNSTVALSESGGALRATTTASGLRCTYAAMLAAALAGREEK